MEHRIGANPDTGYWVLVSAVTRDRGKNEQIAMLFFFLSSKHSCSHTIFPLLQIEFHGFTRYQRKEKITYFSSAYVCHGKRRRVVSNNF